MSSSSSRCARGRYRDVRPPRRPSRAVRRPPSSSRGGGDAWSSAAPAAAGRQVLPHVRAGAPCSSPRARRCPTSSFICSLLSPELESRRSRCAARGQPAATQGRTRRRCSASRTRGRTARRASRRTRGVRRRVSGFSTTVTPAGRRGAGRRARSRSTTVTRRTPASAARRAVVQQGAPPTSTRHFGTRRRAGALPGGEDQRFGGP